MGHILHPRRPTGLSRVDIPDSVATSPTTGDPNDPKTWSGPWLTVTNPTELATIIKNVNQQQYHQAHNTPFGSGPLANQIGRNGDTAAASNLINGILPSNISTLMYETQQVLQTLSNPCPRTETDAIITMEAFRDSYKIAKETTSSSPSGRHIGHCKAVIQEPSLSALHAAMMSIPFQTGIVPERWRRVTDIMLEKSPGDSRCHRLRIIALFESDLNHAKRILIGRKVSHLLEDTKMLSEMQYGSRPGKRCISAVLKKVLQHDHIRLQKSTAAFVENDATGCYDRLINSLILMVLNKLGLPSTTTSFLGNLWNSTIHLIKTIYGTSTIT